MIMPHDIAPRSMAPPGDPKRVLVGLGGIVLIILVCLGAMGDLGLALLLFLYLAGLAVVLHLVLASPR